MRIPRIFVETPLGGSEDVRITGGALNHIARVLRLRAGAEVLLFDGRGGEWRARLETIRAEHANAQLVEHVRVDRESPLEWQLVQGVSRGERMDYTLQKCVELGVAAIHPVMMKRTVVKLQGDKAERRREHWQGVVRSAAEQSGRTAMPAVHEIASFDDFLASCPDGLVLMLDPLADTGIQELDIARPEKVFLLTGPEGGFDDRERTLAYRSGAKGVRLGPRILRTETAALVAAALLLARWGDC